MNPKKIQRLNVDFWSFVHLITTFPELYLTQEGKLINKIVTLNGKCQNLSKLSKNINIDKNLLGEICKKIQNEGHIVIFKECNFKSIKFDEKVRKEGLKIIEN